jgi:TetR/AcrR family transcriptional regulator
MTVRQRDAARTRAEILAVATREFADRGYAGSRIDDIAERMRTTKRMIYYYFGSKEQLFIAVLEQAYSEIRAAEQALDVEGLDSISAIRRLAELTYDHHTAHPDFLRLVSIENIHHGQHISKSERLGTLANPVLGMISRILDRGSEDGVFRPGVDALDVHMMISSFCVFPVANRYTFRAIFGRDLLDGSRHDQYRTMVGELVVRYLTARS